MDGQGKITKAVLNNEETVRKPCPIYDLAERAARGSVLDVIRGLERNSGIQRMLEEIKQHDAMTRLVIGPMEEFRRAGIFQHASLLSNEMELLKRSMADWDARFRLPDMSETFRLVNEFQNSPASKALRRYEEAISSMKNAIESMRTPWLDIHDSMRSISGFATLQGIGHALSNMSAFEDHLTASLRIDLGDWRDRITWPTDIFTDLGKRSDFYIARGFDTALTDFPAMAFQESIELSGLRTEPPPLIDFYGGPVSSAELEEEEGLVRTNTAHDRLLRLETQVRRFIDEQMTQAFGPDWPRHRLPNGLYDQWIEKKRKAEQAGGKIRPLIAYADFTDYVLVICRRDNWPIFAPFFSRQEDLREAFQRLHPIRVDTMHARPITQDDELLLFVEVRRLSIVMIRRTN
ncbi:MAG: hypothetical protein OJF47_003861 [Nitrospira sp.]|jgi:hypothetical protein|nr:MAG: hypothetical protein OJF47_003861 [Nitrospira sp.]